MDIYRELIRLEDDEYLTGIQKSIKQNLSKSCINSYYLYWKISIIKNIVKCRKKVLQILHEKYKEPLTFERSRRTFASECHVSRTTV